MRNTVTMNTPDIEARLKGWVAEAHEIVQDRFPAAEYPKFRHPRMPCSIMDKDYGEVTVKFELFEDPMSGEKSWAYKGVDIKGKPEEPKTKKRGRPRKVAVENPAEVTAA